MSSLLDLQLGGYPFGANDLDLEEWRDMGILKRLLDDRQETRRMTTMLELITARRG